MRSIESEHTMNYMDKGMIRELSDDLITRAANGEEKALERILEIFDPYITAVSSFDRVLMLFYLISEKHAD